MPEPVARIPVVVAARQELARGITGFEFRAADGAALQPFTPGAHIVVPVPSGGVRKYSLCDEPGADECYRIAVKREEAGKGGSVSLIDQTEVGARLEIGAPRNDFNWVEGAPAYILIAGGIGITPIRSMARHLAGQGHANVRVFYMTRGPDFTAFRDECREGAFGARAVLHHDGGDPEKAYDLWPVLERPTAAQIYCCGPRPLMEGVRDMTGHWPTGSVHFEDFGAAAKSAAENKPFRVRLANAGQVLDVPADKTLLEVLRAAGHTVASSCESGTCGTCRVPLVDGIAEHRDLVLSPSEQERAIMVCVSRALSPELVLGL